MYKSKLNIKETQKAIKIVKDNFEKLLAENFNLDRVSAPIIVPANQNINDDLGIKDSALNFYVKTLDKNVEIVQSLAKWKRIALSKYGYNVYEGIYTDMNAIRALDEVDQTHSLYVDQWDWELVINESDRNHNFLEETVKKIVKAIAGTKAIVQSYYSVLNDEIESNVFFITTKELANIYPNLSVEEREYEITKKHKTVFIKQIGADYDLRAPDYDDWLLNGDLLIWSNVIKQPIELSSMGIRVNKERLLVQMEYSNRLEDIKGSYYDDIINDKLPLTIGGGIGQSRLCMVLLEKYHIAEVQASIWSESEKKLFKEMGIKYL